MSLVLVGGTLVRMDDSPQSAPNAHTDNHADAASSSNPLQLPPAAPIFPSQNSSHLQVNPSTPSSPPPSHPSSDSCPSRSLSPTAITQFIDDLRCNDLSTRLHAFQQIPLIARALGSDRVRKEFLPYLNEFVDEEDEVLLELGKQLSFLCDYVGGMQFLNVLLVPLEHLCGVEESCVRDQAVESIIEISRRMDDSLVCQDIFPLIERLSKGEWFTSRVSSCSLYSPIYPRVQLAGDQEKLVKLRQFFIHLCADETPMVRRAACSEFPHLISVLDYDSVKGIFFNAFSKLAKDDQDSVRLLTVGASVAIAKQFKPADNVTKMLPMIFGLCGDKSWRVRYMVAEKFVDLCNSIGGVESKSDDLVDGFVRLLQDEEAEVRTAAAVKVGEVAKLVGSQQTVKKLLHPLKTLVRDQSQYVRAALASTIMSISVVISKKDTIDHLVPLFLILLRDSNSEVRLNIISKLESINLVMSVENLAQSLLPAISELATDSKWRVRLQIIQHIPTLAKQLGHEFFDAKLADLCMNWLGDQVYSIREAATSNLTKLAQVFGVEWAKTNILPKVINLGHHKSYLYRMTALHAIQDITAILGPQLTQENLFPVLIRLCSDPVPNVRFNCIRTLTNLLVGGALGNRQHLLASNPGVLPLITKLTQDPDTDVKYYAQLCLLELQKKD